MYASVPDNEVIKMIGFADDCVPCILILVTFDEEKRVTKARALKLKPEYMVPFERELSQKMRDIICESFENKKVEAPRRDIDNYKLKLEGQKEGEVQTEILRPYHKDLDPRLVLEARLTARPRAFPKATRNIPNFQQARTE